MKPIACVREIFLCVVRQWLPQSMEWKEVIEGYYPTFDEASARAIQLNSGTREAYVTKEIPKDKAEASGRLATHIP